VDHQPAAEQSGLRLADRYVLEEPVASGGMATVWRARDEVLGRPVAVKILHEHLARDRDLLERFRLEAVAAARLSHPSAIRVFDTGVEKGVCFIVMELLQGDTLADLIHRRGPLEPPEAAAMILPVLHALAHAHRARVVHRDVKPSNVLVGPEGMVKVVDFGIAKAAFTGGDLTTTGNLLGSARYLAPEQVQEAEVDGRADLYAVGIVLYELLTGRPPFDAPTHLAAATLRLTTDPRPPGALRSGISRELDAFVIRALARDPDDRFQTAEEMASALDRAVPGAAAAAGPAPVLTPAEPAPAPGPGLRSWITVPLALIVLAALVVGGFLLYERLGLEPGEAGEGLRLQTLDVERATVHDPPPGDGSETDDRLPEAFDGDPATFWETEGYNSADHGGAKDGVGIVFDLGSVVRVSEVRLRTAHPGWEFELRGSDDGTTFGEPLPSRNDQTEFDIPGEEQRVQLRQVRHRYVMVWITTLVQTSDRFRASVAEVELRGPR
jgi:serine/threonine protein kinase